MLVVLAQNPKGGGLSSQFGGSGTTQLMGVKKTGDFLEKATWTLAIALLALTLVANVMVPEKTADGITSPNLENAGSAPSALPSLGGDDTTEDDDSDNIDELLDYPEESTDTTSAE